MNAKVFLLIMCLLFVRVNHALNNPPGAYGIHDFLKPFTGLQIIVHAPKRLYPLRLAKERTRLLKALDYLVENQAPLTIIFLSHQTAVLHRAPLCGQQSGLVCVRRHILPS